MPVVFSESIIHLIGYFAVLAILIGTAIYLAGLFRANSLQQEPKAADHLDYFRELNLQGKLSEAEFRIIKKQLSLRIVEEEKVDKRKDGSAGIDFTEDLPPDVAVLLARATGKNPVPGPKTGDDDEHRDDTRLFGRPDSGATEDTVVL